MKHINPKLQRFYEAYLMMAERARYRPAAPSDGFGNIQLTLEQVRDTHRLQQEAIAYALESGLDTVPSAMTDAWVAYIDQRIEAFDQEKNTDKFWIGCSDYKTNRAFVWSIEAARLLAAGDADDKAIVLLQMALEEVQGVRSACLRAKGRERV